jgi:type VI secretion system secreted protein VgrG
MQTRETVPAREECVSRQRSPELDGYRMNMTDLVQAIRGGLIQQDRLLKTDIPSLPNDTLVPHRAVTSAELGRDFSVALDMLSAAGDIELKKLIAQPMTLWIQQADKSYVPVNGYIHTARRLGANGSLTSYQMTFASWMYFLKFRSDMRNWQDKSADEIITDVFNEHPQAKGYFQFALSQPLPQRSYCRQSESDWNFVHRLMEDEGQGWQVSYACHYRRYLYSGQDVAGDG